MDNKKQYDELSKYYCNTLKDFIDYSKNENLIPFHYKIFISDINNYIDNNKVELIENGLIYILKNKEYIVNYSFDNLKKQENEIIIKQLKTFNQSIVENELNVIFDIIDNAKKLEPHQQNIIKQFLDIIIIILEKIEELLK